MAYAGWAKSPGGSYSAPPDSLAVIRGSEGVNGERVRNREGKERDGREWEERERREGVGSDGKGEGEYGGTAADSEETVGLWKQLQRE